MLQSHAIDRQLVTARSSALHRPEIGSGLGAVAEPYARPKSPACPMVMALRCTKQLGPDIEAQVGSSKITSALQEDPAIVLCQIPRGRSRDRRDMLVLLLLIVTRGCRRSTQLVCWFNLPVQVQVGTVMYSHTEPLCSTAAAVRPSTVPKAATRTLRPSSCRADLAVFRPGGCHALNIAFGASSSGSQCQCIVEATPPQCAGRSCPSHSTKVDIKL